MVTEPLNVDPLLRAYSYSAGTWIAPVRALVKGLWATPMIAAEGELTSGRQEWSANVADTSAHCTSPEKTVDSKAAVAAVLSRIAPLASTVMQSSSPRIYNSLVRKVKTA